jgi:hypothetical protein
MRMKRWGASEERSKLYCNTVHEHHRLQRSDSPQVLAVQPARLVGKLVQCVGLAYQ